MNALSENTIKITSDNPELLTGILIIFGVFTVLYLIIWTQLNTARQRKLIQLRNRMMQVHSRIESEQLIKLRNERAKKGHVG